MILTNGLCEWCKCQARFHFDNTVDEPHAPAQPGFYLCPVPKVTPDGRIFAHYVTADSFKEPNER
jgi:hypothetical protein